MVNFHCVCVCFVPRLNTHTHTDFWTGTSVNLKVKSGWNKLCQSQNSGCFLRPAPPQSLNPLWLPQADGSVLTCAQLRKAACVQVNIPPRLLWPLLMFTSATRSSRWLCQEWEGGFAKHSRFSSVTKKVEKSYLVVVFPSNYHHLMNPRTQWHEVLNLLHSDFKRTT